MKLIFTTQGTDWDSPMDPRFGRTPYFFMYDEESAEILTHDNTAIDQEAHGAGPKTAQKLAEMGAEILITGNGPGGNAAVVLQAIRHADRGRRRDDRAGSLRGLQAGQA